MAGDRRSADGGERGARGGDARRSEEPSSLTLRRGSAADPRNLFASLASVRGSGPGTSGRVKGPRLPGRRGAGGGGGRRRELRTRRDARLRLRRRRRDRNVARRRLVCARDARRVASFRVSRSRRATHRGRGERARAVGETERERRRDHQQRRGDSRRQALYVRGFGVDAAKRVKRLFVPREIPARHRCARPPVARAAQRERAPHGVHVRRGGERREGAEDAREWEQGHERRGSGGSNLALSRQSHESSVPSKRGVEVRLPRGPQLDSRVELRWGHRVRAVGVRRGGGNRLRSGVESTPHGPLLAAKRLFRQMEGRTETVQREPARAEPDVRRASAELFRVSKARRDREQTARG